MESGSDSGRPQNGKMPRDHKKQNKQVDSIVKKLGMDKNQRREFHDEIHGQGYDYQQLMQIAQDIVNEGD